jgi:basic membrane protein A
MDNLSRMTLNRRLMLKGAGAGLGLALCPSQILAANTARIALIMGGTISDGGWNQLAFEGLGDLKAEGFDTAYVENVTQARIQEVAQGYADDGYDLLIGHSYAFGSAFLEIAPDYPDQNFFVTTFAPDEQMLPNLQFVDFAYEGAAYAAGALAALISDNRKAVGFVGGGDNPTQQAMNRAFVAGAETAVPGIKGLGVVTGDYNNAAKGKEAALTMIGNGADVIWHAADVTGLGAIQGAASAGAKVLGCYANQTSLAPDRMATSFVTNLRWMVREVSHSVADKAFKGGTEWRPTIKEVWVPSYGETEPLQDFNPALVSEEAKAAFAAVVEEVSTGQIDINQFK